MKMAWRNFVRNKGPSAASVLAVAALAAFLLVFINNISLSEAELDNAYATIPVNAYIANVSAGKLPIISEDRLAAITSSGFVANYRVAAQCTINKQDTLIGLENADAYTVLKEYLDDIQWLEGCGADILASAQNVCIVPQSMGLEIGAALAIKLDAAGKETEFTVAGVYPMIGTTASAIYCPLEAFKQLHLLNGKRITYSMLEMELCNTRALADFRAEMDALGLKGGSAKLVINDALLNNVTEQLNKQISLLKTLLPVLFALIIIIGFGISFLLLRRRKREAAVMRSVGATRGTVLRILLGECTMQCFCGAALGAAAVFAAIGGSVGRLSIALAVAVCYLAGGALAAYRLVNVNVLKLMTSKE